MGAGNIIFEKNGSDFMGRFEYRIFNFLRQIKKVEGRICDIGCGGAEFLKKIKKLFPESQCFGCDISHKAIELGSTVPSPWASLKIIESDGILPYENNFFDICVSTCVLEHVADIEAQLKEINRILKIGGLVHICVPCEGQPLSMNWLYQKTGWGKNFTFKNWGHIQPQLTHEKMIDHLKATGFEVKKISYSLHLPVDFLNLFLYFLPKEILEAVFKARAFQFTDASMVEAKVHNRKNRGFFYFFRSCWLSILAANEVLRTLDAILLGNIPFTASTVHITCRKKFEI